MRFGRNIFFLLLLVVFLSGALVALRFLRPEQPLQGGDALFPMRPEKVIAIQWEMLHHEAQPLQVELRREGELWRMMRPYARAVCDEAAIADLLDAAQSLRVLARLGSPMSTSFRPERRLSLSTADNTRTCGFGEVLPMRLSETLAEVEGALVSVEAATVARLPRQAAMMRTRAVLPVDASRLTTLEWRAPRQPFTRVQRLANGTWRVTQPFPFMAKAADVEAALATLTQVRAITAYIFPSDQATLTAEGFVPPCPTSESALAVYGLDAESALRVTFRARGLGEAMTLRFGKADPEREGNVFCLLDGYQAIVSVPQALRAVFEAQGPFVTDYRDLPVLGEIASVEHLTLRTATGDAPTELKKGRAGWAITLPIALPADAATMRALLRDMAGMTGDLLGTEPPETTPLCMLRLTMTSGSAPIELELYAEGADSTGGLLAYRSDTQRLYRVRREAVPELLLKGGFSHALADRTVLAEPAAGIRRITVVRKDGAREEVVRPSDSLLWETEYPKGAFLETATLDTWLTRFADLKAVRVLHGEPTAFGALRPYGLDRPTLRLTLDLSGETGLRRVLLVGEPDATTGAAPALIQGRPILYELDAETIQLLARPLTVRESVRQ